MFIISMMPSSHLILWHHLLFLPSIFPIWDFSFFFFNFILFNFTILYWFWHISKWICHRYTPSVHIRWPKCWNLSFSISPSREYAGLISFKIDWLDLIAVQGTFRGLLQHHSLKASVVATQRDNAESGVQFITPGPKAESPLSQGPLPVFVKTLYTL